MKHYDAPWSKSLLIMSAIGGIICLGGAVAVVATGRWWVALFPLSVFCGAILFVVRGYTINHDLILIHRLFWATRLPLTALRSAHFAPNAMRRSFRLFGNGGLLSFTGYFHNSALGTYRAFVTDPQRTVKLDFPARTVVISPSAPDKFVHDLGQIRGADVSQTLNPALG